ncbi:MAG TPA: hypothetical protein VGQ64_07955 [Candidatus Limnocylindrales bacterium]|nr:hypothetical protein [Candidatus Limnocylindrales bacterium]
MSAPALGLVIEDPAGEAWQREADRRWRSAERKAAGRSGGRGNPMRYYVAPSLPAWPVPPFVTREIQGRFLLDCDSGVVHDVGHATEACAIDAIRNATWTHFAHELERSTAGSRERLQAAGREMPEASPCSYCLLPYARPAGRIQ